MIHCNIEPEILNIFKNFDSRSIINLKSKSLSWILWFFSGCVCGPLYVLVCINLPQDTAVHINLQQDPSHGSSAALRLIPAVSLCASVRKRPAVSRWRTDKG